jgi:hypothetical protein
MNSDGPEIPAVPIRRRDLMLVPMSVMAATVAEKFAFGDQMSDLLKQATPRTVKVNVSNRGYTTKTGVGILVERYDPQTGMPGKYVLTSLHVLMIYEGQNSNAEKPPANSPASPINQLIIKLDFGSSIVQGGFVFSDETLDLALLKPLEDIPTDAKCVEINDKNPENGEKLFVVGGPTIEAQKEVYAPLVIDEANYRGLAQANMNCLYCDVNLVKWDGKSGSGVFNKDGKVVGLVREQRQPGVPGKAFPILAVSSPVLIQFLARNVNMQAHAAPANVQFIGGFNKIAAQVNVGGNPAIAPPAPNALSATFTATDDSGDISQRMLWTATQIFETPAGINIDANNAVMQAVEGGGIQSEQGDHFLQNNVLGFDAVLGKTFTRVRENLAITQRFGGVRQIRRLIAEDQNGIEKVELILDQMPLDTFEAAQMYSWRGDLNSLRSICQNELARQRKENLHLFLVDSDEPFEQAGRTPVQFGMVDQRISGAGISNWQFRFTNGIPDLGYRYRSYRRLDAPSEIVVLYVVDFGCGRVFVAHFQHSPDPKLTNVVAGPLFDKWALLLTLRIWQ